MLNFRLTPFAFCLTLLAASLPSISAAEGESPAGEMLAMISHQNASLFDAAPAKVPAPQPNSAQTANAPLSLTPDTNLPQPNLWRRIRNGFAMPELDTNLVARHERWYSNQPEYVARMTERAQRYLYFIVQEVERRGMPTEIALLPMIESAFNPTAYSVSRASGIWQFIPSTGKHFGMQQNWWYDGRRDVISATNGALDYLQALHDQFGSWDLALAAYNCGEHCIERAQRNNRKRHKPVDYLSLKLPKETRNYVPKLLAMKNVIANPASHGLVLQDIPNQPYFAAVSTPRHMDVAVAAELAGISMEEFLALNPGHSRPVILQDESTLILLPADKAPSFMAKLESHDKPLVSWQPYQSKKGERFDQIAEQFGITLEKLKTANGISTHATVSTGQKLLVPAASNEVSNDFVAFNMHLAPTLDDRHTVQHIVRRGETLGSIARRYHVSVASLKAWNGNHTLIRPGQRLTVAGGHAAKHTQLAKSKTARKQAKRSGNHQVS